MITQNDLAKALMVSSQLEDKNITLTVKEDSYLRPLVEAISLPPEDVVSNLSDSEVINDVVGITNKVPVETQEFIPSRYDSALSDIVSTTIPDFQVLLKTVRSEINPFVKALVDSVQHAITSLDPKDLIKTKVNTAVVPDVILDSQFQELLNRFSHSEIIEGEIPASPVLADVDSSVVMGWLAGYPGIGGLLVKDLSDDLVKEVYHGVFRQNWRGVNNLGHYLRYHPEHVKIALIVFVLANWFINDLPEGSTGSPSEIIDHLEYLRGQAGLAIKSYLEKLDKEAQNGIIISSRSNNEIRVNPFTYHGWIKDGGDVEAILGLSLQRNTYQSVEEINEHKEELKSLWQEHVNNVTRTTSDDMVQRVKESLEFNFHHLISEDPFHASEQEYREVTNLFTDLLQYVRQQDIENIHVLTLKLVSRSLAPIYPSLNAELFLSSIDTAFYKYPNITVKEAASIAAIYYLVDAIAGGIAISR
nr:MAG TPA: hypothetical protein [Caudoviricetes sp.]